MSYVVDASSILAVILNESGRERVRSALAQRPHIASVNLGEVAHRLILKERPREAVARLLNRYPLVVVDVDRDLALEAGFAARYSKDFGLSYADRVCLMLAKRIGKIALTGDRKWLLVADALGVKVELFR